MEIIKFNNLNIEVNLDELYKINSTDNINKYDNIYFSNSINKDYSEYAPKYNITIKEKEDILKKVLLISSDGGPTEPHKKSILIDNNSLIIIIGDSIFSLSLPDLSINWVTECINCITCFEVFNCIDGYIIHGELSIIKLNKLGKIEWEFSGRDIFTTIDGLDDFQVFDGYIIAKDWGYHIYKIDIMNGMEII